ncbi:DUF1653 domain-containing protein [Entomobacter blattae]|uniref:DUF1653 domain-containing protein n=1 Tax=Entomobacter blattae TaxID=2762277 RepID=A0A7H1NQL1_9PROT|nr:DUF1653 domain-containing protein [Entomobacter blattae]QNT78071.1 hypothetical protein JGUZn3_08390 [Entomobacter blattae]
MKARAGHSVNHSPGENNTSQFGQMSEKVSGQASGQTPLLPVVGRYRHYKGGEYTVLFLARHSETEEWMVVYRSEKEGTYWVRPREMWMQTAGDGVPRFTKMDEGEGPP